MLNIVQFLYENYKGETETRTVRPIEMWFGSTAWHPRPQWFLRAFDLDRGADRDFAMSGMRSGWTTRDAGKEKVDE